MSSDCLRLSPNLSDFLTGFYPIFQLETLLCVVPVSSIILGVNLCTILVYQTCTSRVPLWCQHAPVQCTNMVQTCTRLPVYQWSQDHMGRTCFATTYCSQDDNKLRRTTMIKYTVNHSSLLINSEHSSLKLEVHYNLNFWKCSKTCQDLYAFALKMGGRLPKCPSAQRQCGTITEQDTWVLVLPMWNSWVKLLKLVNLVKIWCEHMFGKYLRWIGMNARKHLKDSLRLTANELWEKEPQEHHYPSIILMPFHLENLL